MQVRLLPILLLFACVQMPAPSPSIAEGVFHLGCQVNDCFDGERWRANVEQIFGPGVTSEMIAERLRAQGFVIEASDEHGREAKFSWPANANSPEPGCQPNVGVLWSELASGEAHLIATTTANC